MKTSRGTPLQISLVFVILSPIAFLVAGCTGAAGLGQAMTMASIMQSARQAAGGDDSSGQVFGGRHAGMPDMAAMEAKNRLMQDLMSNPDLTSWHEQRQKMMLALGDRTFDKNFEEVFDGMIIALASLGCRVNNMERTSGYITASLPDLGPDRTNVLQQEAVAEYARVKGYPASVLQKQSGFDFDADMGSHMIMRMGGSGLTMTIAKQSPTQTRVKLRFDNVYFPKSAQEYYRVVWVGVDRQMFLDKALDAPRT